LKKKMENGFEKKGQIGEHLCHFVMKLFEKKKRR